MSKFLKLTVALAVLATPLVAGPLGLGRPALPEEIAAWNIDVRPDGTGLPIGSGDVLTGEEIFAEQCAACHGDFAEGVGNWPKLAGGAGTLARKDPLKTVGSYWPYLSTTWDYVHRSMPYGNAQSLSADEVYAMVAYILYSNDLVDEDFVLSNETFLDVEMPNADGFIMDDRIETEFSLWVGEPCMENCKSDVQVTMRALVLDVTPDHGGTATVEETAAPVVAPSPVMVAVDAELVAAGEKVFKKCSACHQVGSGAQNKVGPVLNGIMGRAAGTIEGFGYSKALMDRAAEGLIWSDAEMRAFLENPRKHLKGTRMSFAGLRKDSELDAIAAYLSTFPAD